VGHVFQGRYKAILVERDSYLLELARYVVLSPLRAKMVNRLDAWPWSSYLATCGQSAAPGWLQTDWILAQFGKQRVDATARPNLPGLGSLREDDAGKDRKCARAGRNFSRATAGRDSAPGGF